MYSKSYEENRPEAKDGIPIQNFSDEYVSRSFYRQSPEPSECGCADTDTDVREEAEKRPLKTESQKSTAGSFSGIFSRLKTDDLLLIALILVFLFDNDEKNDILIPVLLGILLLC